VLELYKRGELTWTQDEPFGDITIDVAGVAAGAGPAELSA